MRLGPLPSAWVRAWAVDASDAMRQASGGGVAMPFRVGDDFFERNRMQVRAWLAIAVGTETFEWEDDVDPDVLLPIVQYWRNLAMVRHDMIERGESPPMGADAERFTVAMRRAVLDVLVSSGRMSFDTAARTDASWPAIGASAAGDGDVAQHERHAGRAPR